MKTLLIATHNPGKAREYRDLLSELPLKVVYLDELGITDEVAETGMTLAENAAIKAAHFAQVTGVWTWADDSGLEVDALDGAPGVHSARFAGSDATDADRYRRLLGLLAGIPWARRTARFRCVVTLAAPAGTIGSAEGKIEGIVTFGPAGEYGFGYDPVFYIPEFARTMAQLPPDLKNSVSHRALASHRAVGVLEAHLASSPERPKPQLAGTA